MKPLHILLFFTLYNSCFESRAQLIVKSALDSSGIENANVRSLDGSFSNRTDNFGLLKKCPDNSDVIISHPSYDTLKCTIVKGSIVYLLPKISIREAFVYTGNVGKSKSVSEEIATVKILGQEDLKRTSAQNLGDLLKYETNITLTQDQSLGTSISINGMSGQNVKLLKNGAGITGSMNGSVDVSQLNVNNVEQVEIIEGPMSLLYGSNALAGTINIISKRPSDKNQAVLKSYTESTGIFNFSALSGFKLGKSYTTIQMGRNFFDGWNPGNSLFYSPVNRTADSQRYSLWKPRRQLMAELNIYLPIGKKSELKFNTDLLLETIINKGMPMAPYYESAFDDYYKTNRMTNSVEFNSNAGKFKHNVLASYNVFNRRKNTFLNDLTKSGELQLTSPENQDTTIIQSTQFRYISTYKTRHIKFNGGIDYNYEGFLGKRVINNNKSIYNISFVGIAGFSLFKNIDMKVGLRQSINSMNKIPLVPSVSLKFNIRKNTIFKLSAGKGFRTPGIKELYLYFVDINHNIKGNPELKSESSNNINLQLDHKGKVKKMMYKLKLNAYANNFKNLITLAAINATEYTYVNLGTASNFGTNSEIGVYWKRVEMSYRNSILTSTNNLSGTTLPKYFTSLNHSVITSVNLGKKSNFRINAFINLFGKTPSISYIDDQPIVVKTDDYTMIDLTFNWNLKIKSNVLIVSGGLRNLADISNIKTGISNGIAHQSSNGQRLISTGRSFFLGIEIKL